ncbi:transposase [Persicobacter psychrovividus]|uniref:Transposase InsH N-terminal domain-containing protein n=1 Tax=Persicobacter psychrovividus TaxID=387638 RepID=A0ABN6LDV9_9BACT|nr:hypothetical protein PEPS_36040 [Persicobacter psychrovividus]
MIKKKFKSYQKDQVSLFPLSFGELVPPGHIARVIDCFVNGLSMDLLARYFTNQGGNAPYNPRMMMKLLLFGYQSGVFSSRKIEAFTYESIPCLWLCGGEHPDHATIARFRSLYFLDIFQDVFVQLILLLVEKGLVNLEDYVLDGTKLEADANKYKMVFKKNAFRYSKMVREKIIALFAEIDEIEKQSEEEAKKGHKMDCEDFSSEEVYAKAQEIEKSINEDLPPKEKKKIETRCRHLKKGADKLKGYEDQLQELGERNSYSKTDIDATYMRMKNDESRPGYNVQVGTNGEFITGATAHQNGGDSACTIDHLEERSKMLEQVNLDSMPETLTADGATEQKLYLII